MHFSGANKWDCGEWRRLLKAGGLCTVPCARYFFAHCCQKWPWELRTQFGADPLPHRVFLKDMQSMKERSGAGSPALSVPQQLPPTTTKPWAKWLCDHCAQEGPKGTKERPERTSQGRSGAGTWFLAPDWLQSMSNRNRVEFWLLCLFCRKGCKLPYRNSTSSLPHHTNAIEE